MLPSLLLLLVLLYTGTVTAEDTAYSVTITTVPSQGPFRIRQPVQFSCLIEPTPPDPVTYQWRRVEHAYGGGTHTQQNISTSYYYRNLHYCYYLCEVSVNQTLLGSASRIVEVQGLLFTEAPVVQSFKHGGSLELNMNMSNDYYARYISSLAWYHNGTKLSSGSKYSISNNATRLRITNMTGSDAGHYMVKIASINYDSYNDSAECDSLVLPLLESTALHAPVTFTVQEDCVPAYDPFSIVSVLYISENSGPGTIDLMKTVQLNYSLIPHVSSHWYRNGTRITNGDMYSFTQEQSLQITYNNTADVIGDYIGVLWQYGFYLTDDIPSMCRGYNYYIDNIFSFFSSIPLLVSFWSAIRLPSVHLHFEEPILSQLETTTVECAIVGGEPVEALNLTLWRNEELLAHTSGRNLSYLTTPHPYGTYRCSVGSVHNTSILLEKVNFQLLLDDDLLMEEQCQHQKNEPQLAIDDLKAAISGIFRRLCQSCDDVYPSDIVDVQLNCSASGRFAYLTASLVYSAPDGRITASTLINMLLTWLLSEDTPSILVNGTAVGLNKQCLTQLNSLTRNACIEVFSSDALEAFTTTTKVTDSPKSSLFTVVGFFGGLVAGILVTVIIIALIICVMKLRVYVARAQPVETAKPADIPMGTNQAYESVEPRYQAGGMQEDEVIYELPA